MDDKAILLSSALIGGLMVVCVYAPVFTIIGLTTVVIISTL